MPGKTGLEWGFARNQVKRTQKDGFPGLTPNA
jgi:hypothetical protein